ncbi:MAG: hypothetical protein ACI841_001473 [Planctomycetota bacterium]|jgi:hypothetical protein
MGADNHNGPFPTTIGDDLARSADTCPIGKCGASKLHYSFNEHNRSGYRGWEL